MYSLLVMTISGSIIALLLMVLRYTVLRKMPSTVYYYAWLLVLLRFALPLPGLVPTTVATADFTPAPTSPAVYSEMNAQENVQKDVQAVTFENVQENTQQVSEFDYSDVSKNDTTVSNTAPKAAETQQMTVIETAPKAAISIDWKSPVLWLSVWAIGAVVSMGITVLSYFHYNFNLKKKLMEPDGFTKAVYDSIPGRKPALYISDSARTPLLLGVFKPMIVLPYRKYNEELLLNILRHELTHYRRFDTLYKWVASAILAMHWFNPVAWFIHREFNRACELSCDEMLLRSMDRDEKESYGNSLLLMAAQSPLPSAVVATSFATEKRNLKERLVQIMNYKKSGTRLLSTILAVVLLTGCAVTAGPFENGSGKGSENGSGNGSEYMSPAPGTAGGTVKVKTVDEFLAAIAPNTVIELAEGNYDLSKASNYDAESNSKYYSWEHDVGETEKSAELIIHDVEGLTIRGAGIGNTTIEAVPRFVNVINFSNCSNITISDLTAGHTKGQGVCTGGVLLVMDSSDFTVDSCGLFGCGTTGVHGINSKKINVTNCDIYECSVSAINVGDCEDVLVSGCDIHNNGEKDDLYIADRLFESYESSNFTVYNCKVHDNKTEGLIYTRGSHNIMFLSNDVTNNTFTQSTFYFESVGTIVVGCHFEGNTSEGWYIDGARIKAIDINGKELDTDELKAMGLRDIKPETVTPKEPTPAPTMTPMDVAPGTELTVKTVDEFLSAIGSNRTIVLDGTNFKLTTAMNYGTGETELYNWCKTPDGPSLIIYDVKNLTIKAKNSDPAATTFETVPLSSDVLSFIRCENITVTGFTIGHTKKKDSSNGGALDFEECSNIKIEKMRINGCGGKGIHTNSCNDIDIINTEIFDCDNGAGWFTETNGINFVDCNIHDINWRTLLFYSCKKRTWNGKELDLTKWCFDIKPDGTLEGRDTSE